MQLIINGKEESVPDVVNVSDLLKIRGIETPDRLNPRVRRRRPTVRRFGWRRPRVLLACKSPLKRCLMPFAK